MHQTIQSAKELDLVSDNYIIGTTPDISNSSIVFNGTGNTLYCEDNVRLVSSRLVFNGNNALVMLGSNRHAYHVDITVNNNCSAIVGRNNYFNGKLNCVSSEQCSIVFGNDGLYSFGIWIRTADPHLIYDIESHRRINPSKNVVIGDRVWIGQNAMVLKGSRIGSGAIIGAGSVVAGKTIPSNSSWAGNPVKEIRRGVFWDSACVHTWTTPETELSQTNESCNGIFSSHGQPDQIDCLESWSQLVSKSRLEQALAVFFCVDDSSHNRFFIPQHDNSSPSTRKRLPRLRSLFHRDGRMGE